MISDHRIASVSDERESGDGIWVYLKDGYINTESDTHMIHEDTWKEIRSMMKFVKPCDCPECMNLKPMEYKS